MLSVPPAVFARSMRTRHGLVGRIAREHARDLRIRKHAREPVRAEQEAVTPGQVDLLDVDLDFGLSADGAQDLVALRMHARFFGRQLPTPHELADHRVVVGDLLEHAVAQAVGAAVADVRDPGLPLPSKSSATAVVPMPARSVSARLFS